jgi:hypothetical protein
MSIIFFYQGMSSARYEVKVEYSVTELMIINILIIVLTQILSDV